MCCGDIKCLGKSFVLLCISYHTRRRCLVAWHVSSSLSTDPRREGGRAGGKVGGWVGWIGPLLQSGASLVLPYTAQPETNMSYTSIPSTPPVDLGGVRRWGACCTERLKPTAAATRNFVEYEMQHRSLTVCGEWPVKISTKYTAVACEWNESFTAHMPTYSSVPENMG